MGVFQFKRWCAAPRCVNVREYQSAYCADHLNLRGQHAVNHKYDGHVRESIVMCPLCEEAQKKATAAGWPNQPSLD